MTTTKKAALKVHQLAKELGVNSKDIVAKCQAEEIPDITTHLSPVSIGLAQTIREWFSEGENITTVETAEKVDLSEVRVKRPQRTKVMQTSPSTEEADGSGSVEAAVAEAEPSDEMEAPQEEAEAPAPAVAAVMEVEQAEEEPVQAPVVAVEAVPPGPPVVVTEPPPAPEVETEKGGVAGLPVRTML